MTIKKPNFIYTFEKGTPTKEECDKAFIDLIRVLCKLSIEEQINNSCYTTQKAKLLPRKDFENYVERFFDDIKKI